MAIFSRNGGHHQEENDAYDSNEKVSDDVEVGQEEPRNIPGHQEKEDPFGDESNSEVKYRTMAWWSVALSPNISRRADI